MTIEEYLQSSDLLRFSEAEWPVSIHDDLKACQLPARQQIKAIEAMWRSGGLAEVFRYVNKQKEKAAADPSGKKSAEVLFWETFLKWFNPEYVRGGVRAELDKRLQNAGLGTNDKKQDRELRWQCINELAAGFIQTWCAECNYLGKTQSRGFRSDDERE